MTNATKTYLTDKAWQQIEARFLDTEGDYTFSVGGVEFVLDYTQSEKFLVWHDGEVIAWSTGCVADLRETIEQRIAGSNTHRTELLSFWMNTQAE